MKKLLLWGLLVLIGFFMAACSGGGSSSDSPTAEVPTATPEGFTAEMLDASPTYYVTYPDDDNGSELGTTQETIVFSGTGPYKLTLTEEHFDANDVFVSSEIFPVDVTLNQDGTLTATDSSGVTTVTLTSEISTYLEVNGVNGADTWSDLWYFGQPAGWLTANDDTPTVFTAEMLNDTYYVTYSGDNFGSELGTTQETFTFSGTGPYTVTGTVEYFDASDAFQGSETFTADVTLNQDGTLTVTGSDFVSTETLISETSTYLVVDGVEGTDTWSDLWYLAKPAGWLSQTSAPGTTGFTKQMLDAGPTYYVTYADDDNGSELGTTQETIVFSGTGPYKLTLTEEHFDANDVFVSSEIFPVDVTLNQDGTLTATDSSGVTTVTLTSETSTYLEVNGVNGADTWSDLWYFGQPAGWLSAPVYKFDTVFMQYRVYEDAAVSPRTAAWVSLLKDDVAIQEADIAGIKLFDSTNTEMIPYYTGFSTSTSLYLNCMVSPCSLGAPTTDGGFVNNFNTTVAAGTLSLEVTTAEMQTLNREISYPGQLIVPLVKSATIQSSWVGNDLVLSWKNPSGEANWSEVDQIRINLTDSANVQLLSVRVSPSAETVTINQSVLTQAIALGNGTLGNWQIQTRAYDANSMNFARGYSNRKAIAAK